MMLLTIVMMSGCSSRNIEVKNSGFFKDYDSIKTAGSIVYKESKVDLLSYKNIVVKPVLVISAIKETEQTAAGTAFRIRGMDRQRRGGI